MKTVISVPYETFARVSRRAEEVGMSRSEFFSYAARHYVDELDAQSLTARIDGALARLGATNEAASDAVAVGRRVVGATWST
jgi:metal-responsive CopG/Arc/MetJ family transcriptional regulator